MRAEIFIFWELFSSIYVEIDHRSFPLFVCHSGKLENFNSLFESDSYSKLVVVCKTWLDIALVYWIHWKHWSALTCLDKPRIVLSLHWICIKPNGGWTVSQSAPTSQFFLLEVKNAKARKNARDVFVNFFTHLVLEPPKKMSSWERTPYGILR